MLEIETLNSNVSTSSTHGSTKTATPQISKKEKQAPKSNPFILAGLLSFLDN
jgi:hypothetical protein